MLKTTGDDLDTWGLSGEKYSSLAGNPPPTLEVRVLYSQIGSLSVPENLSSRLLQVASINPISVEVKLTIRTLATIHTPVHFALRSFPFPVFSGIVRAASKSRISI